MIRREHYQRIIEAFESGNAPTAVSAFLDSLEPSQQHQLIASVRSPPVGIAPLKLLRALWSSASLRPKILTTFAATAPRDTTAKETQLLDELELLLGGDAISLDVSESVRLRSITLCATALSKAAARSPFAHHAPLLLFCARAAGRMGTRRSFAVHTRIVKFVLRFLQAPGNLRFASVAALLEEDLKLAFSDETLLIKAIDAFVVLKCRQQQYPALFRTLLTALGRATTRRLMNVIGRLALYVLHVAKHHTVSELLMILGISFVESDQVCSRVLKVLDDLINAKQHFDGLNCAHVRLATSHVSVLYYMLGSSSSQSLRNAIGALLQRIAEGDDLSFAVTTMPSSSTDVTDSDHWRKLVLSKSLDVQAVCAHGEAIAAYFESQIWTGRAKAQRWGVQLLVEVFTVIPFVRRKILLAIYTAVTAHGTPVSVMDTFCKLLEELCSSNRSAFMMRECGESLLNLLKYVEHVPVGYDSRVAEAIVKIGVSIPSMQSDVFLFLQKVTGSRFWKLQRIAAVGLVAVIEHPATSDDTRNEACNTLEKLLELADISVRTYIVVLLTRLIEKDSHRYGQISNVAKLIVNRILVIDSSFNSAQTPSGVFDGNTSEVIPFDFTRNFEKVAGEWYQKDDLAVLLRFCVRVRSQNMVVDKFLEKLMGYMGDASKAVVDVCRERDSSLSVNLQMKQLCTLYEVSICLGLESLSFSHVQAYALSLIIRNFLDSKDQLPGSNNKTKPEKNHPKLDESAVFAATAARSSVFPEESSFRSQSDFRLLLKSYVDALKFLIRFDMKSLLTLAVVTEIMSHVVSVISEKRDNNKEVLLAKEEAETLFKISKMCFSVTCPWHRSISETDSDGEMESVVDSDQTKLSLSESRNVGESNSSDSQAFIIRTETGPQPLTEINLAYADAKKAIETPRLSTQKYVVSSSLRRLSLKVFLNMLTANFSHNQSATTFSFIKDIYRSTQTEDGQNGNDTNDSGHEHRRGCSEATSLVGTVEALTTVFYAEYAHDVHNSVALSYLNLLTHFLSMSSGDLDDEKRVREVIKETLLKILQEYRMPNKKVLRDILTLLAKSFDDASGVQFCSDLFQWLGHDECLLNSKQATREEERDNYIGSNDFDIDILEEGIAIDAEYVGNDRMQDRRNKRRTIVPIQIPEDSLSDESANQQAQRIGHINEDASNDEMIEESDPVRLLHLNDNEETGNISLNCFLNYLGSVLKRSVEVHRKQKKEGNIQQEDLKLIGNIADAIQTLFLTPLAEMKTSWGSRMPLPVRRKVCNMLLVLIELVTSLLTTLSKSVLSGTRAVSHEHQFIRVTEQILRLLCNENADNLFESLYQWDQGSRSAFVQENLEAATTSFLGSTATPRENMKEICSLLQSRVRKRARRKELSRNMSDDDEEYTPRTQLGLRPTKKQRVRSRNKQVDAWLREEAGDDNFADLEDFVVPMDASDL